MKRQSRPISKRLSNWINNVLFKTLNADEFREILLNKEHPLNDYARDYFYSMD